MAALFDLDTHRAPRASTAGSGRPDKVDPAAADPVDTAFGLIRDHLSALEPQPALRTNPPIPTTARRHRNINRRRRHRTHRQRSRRETHAQRRQNLAPLHHQSTRRAAAAAKNKTLLDKMATGDLSQDQVDVIADTAAKTEGAAATDPDFIDKVANTDPDQAKALADDFVAKHQTKDGVETEHQRQRKLRRTTRYTSKKSNLDVLALEGDRVAIDNIHNQIRARADELYRADGGRDLEPASTPAPTPQRMFDAAYELLCNATTTPTNITPTPRHSNDNGNRCSTAKGATSRPGDRGDRPHPRPLPGQRSRRYGRTNRARLIPDNVLADYLAHADILAALYDRAGNPLWMGRTRRNPTLTQRYALIARDKGCVQCRAHHTTCQTHHLTPMERPRQRRNQPRPTRPALRPLSSQAPQRQPHPLPNPRPTLAHPTSHTQRNPATTSGPKPPQARIDPRRE